MRSIFCGQRPAASVLASLLDRAGEDATLLLPTSPLTSGGSMLIERDGGTEEYRPRRAEPGSLEGAYDLVALAGPPPEIGELLRTISPFVHRATFYLSLGGGMEYEYIGEIVGAGRVVVAVPGFACAWTRENSAVSIVGDGLVLGEEDGSHTERVASCADSLARAGLGDVRVSGNVRGELWAGLCLAVPLASFEAITGLPFFDYVDLTGVADLFLQAASEIRELAHGLGLKVEGEFLDALKERDNGGRKEETVRIFFASVRQLPSARVKSSLLVDLEAGRTTDNRFLAGYVADKARSLSLKSPVNNAFSTLIRELESGKRKPSANNLRELKRRVAEEGQMFLA